MRKAAKLVSYLCVAALAVCGLGACNNDANNDKDDDTKNPSTSTPGGDDTTGMSGEIYVISREESSGTRSAFTEILEIIDADGNDATVATAEVTNSTGVMLTTVAGNDKAIGYVSLGSLNDTVKALSVDGVEATADNIKNNTYPVSRPFVMAYKEAEASDLAKDFIAYVMSSQGQAIIAEESYIAADESAEEYTASGLSGSLSIEGSTSVGPVMEILAEAYMELNPDANITVTQDGSGTGITAAIDGGCDIAISSRALKEEEAAELTPVTIATDGIAVIVNTENSIDSLTSEQIKEIFLGNITEWDELN